MLFGKNKKKDEIKDFMQQADQLAKSQFYREALELYQNEWEQNKDNLKALFGVTACLYRLGNYPSAFRHVEILLKENADYPKAESLRDKIQKRLSNHKHKDCLLNHSEEYYTEDDFYEQAPENSGDK
jgi:tetratricopeptide (TPR) repeat protein